ncbi:hypothetical protein E5D57_004179 [Metarhizium anisopliae]|nr:hypothetical protein E5D57_004179 [Metarhizium anisopliae]
MLFGVKSPHLSNMDRQVELAKFGVPLSGSLNEQACLAENYKVIGAITRLVAGAYHLESVEDGFRRTCDVKEY